MDDAIKRQIVFFLEQAIPELLLTAFSKQGLNPILSYVNEISFKCIRIVVPHFDIEAQIVYSGALGYRLSTLELVKLLSLGSPWRLLLSLACVFQGCAS